MIHSTVKRVLKVPYWLNFLSKNVEVPQGKNDLAIAKNNTRNVRTLSIK